MIRKLENKDIEKIMEIWLDSTIKAHNFIPKKYWLDNFEEVKYNYIPISETFVFEEKYEIKGFISILNNDFIAALFVDVRYQKKGIGEKLINFSLKKYKKLNLAVYVNNLNAVNFYKNKGFKILKKQLNADSKFFEYIMEYN